MGDLKVDLLEVEDNIICKNTTQSNVDEGQKSFLVFAGKNELKDEFNSLAKIEGCHSGTSADKKGKLIFKVNDGDDNADTLHTMMTIGPANVENTGTAQAGGNTSITLASGASSTNDEYNNYNVKITAGTGSGQSKKITAYNGTSKVATVDSAWTTNPSNDSEYSVISATVSINGNLNINNVVSSTNTTISDNLIKLGQKSIVSNKDLGIIFTQGDSTNTNTANKGLIWDSSPGTPEFALIGCNNEDGTTSGNIIIDNYENLRVKDLFVTGSVTATNIDGIIGANTPAAITGTTITAHTAIVPDASGGADIGSTSLEWGNIYIGDDKKIFFGADQNATIEYDEDGTDELRFAGAAATFEQAVTFDGAVTLGNATNDTITILGNSTFNGTTIANLGTVSGATSITSTNFVGAIDGIVGANTPAAITGTTITAHTAIVPDASGGADIGSTSLEWGNIYIGDDKKITPFQRS